MGHGLALEDLLHLFVVHRGTVNVVHETLDKVGSDGQVHKACRSYERCNVTQKDTTYQKSFPTDLVLNANDAATILVRHTYGGDIHLNVKSVMKEVTETIVLIWGRKMQRYLALLKDLPFGQVGLFIWASDKGHSYKLTR